MINNLTLRLLMLWLALSDLTSRFFLLNMCPWMTIASETSLQLFKPSEELFPFSLSVFSLCGELFQECVKTVIVHLLLN